MRYYILGLCTLLAAGLIFDYGLVITQRSDFASSISTVILPSPSHPYILQYEIRPSDLVQHLQIYQYVDYREPPSYISFNHVLVPVGGRTSQRLQLVYNNCSINLENENIQIGPNHRYLFSETSYTDLFMDRSVVGPYLQAHGLDAAPIPITSNALKITDLGRPVHLYLLGHTHPNGTFQARAISDDVYGLIYMCTPPSILSVTLLIATCITIFCCICREPILF